MACSTRNGNGYSILNRLFRINFNGDKTISSDLIGLLLLISLINALTLVESRYEYSFGVSVRRLAALVRILEVLEILFVRERMGVFVNDDVRLFGVNNN